PFAQINAERRAVERVLDVVRGERVAGKEQVHVTPCDQFLQMLSGTGVNDGRPADDQDFSTGPFCLAKLPRHLSNDCALGLLARDVARHEFERIGLCGGTLMGNNADTAVTNDKFHPLANVTKLQGDGSLQPAVNGDSTVYHRGPDLDPSSSEVDEGLLCGRDVEVLREIADGRGRSKLNFSLTNQLGAVQTQPADEVIHDFRRRA